MGEYKGEGTKRTFVFANFLGTEGQGVPNNNGWIVYTSGCVEEFAQIFEAQYNVMNAAEMFRESEITSYEEYLEYFSHQGQFDHSMDKPFLSFVSSVLDITIIKPIIEACTGEDLLTGEDLSDLERGLKVVFAIVDLATIGGAVAATKLSEMELKKALQTLGKTVSIEFAANTTVCGVGALGEAFDWPIPITIMLSLATGINVSCKGNKLLFEGEGFSREILLDDVDVEKIGEMVEGGLKSGLTQDVIDRIVTTPKGSRPDPSTYLTQEYIDAHLAKFENGAAYILSESEYDLYYRGVPEIARDDGTLFVTSQDYLNQVLEEANGDLSYVEKALGYPDETLSAGEFKIINIDTPNNYNITVPSGNEAGANSEWIPGGHTSGGVPEAVVHNVPNDPNVININTVSLERK